MSATKYVIAATTAAPQAREVSRKEYAIRIADERAAAIDHAEAVTVTTSTGREVYATVVVTPAAPPATAARASRPAVAEGPRDGWSTIYEKPAIGAEVLRSTEGKYALYCQTHDHLFTDLPTLVSERKARQDANWCPTCVATGGPTTKTFGKKAKAARQLVAA
jgi:hypothetical protein